MYALFGNWAETCINSCTEMGAEAGLSGSLFWETPHSPTHRWYCSWLLWRERWWCHGSASHLCHHVTPWLKLDLQGNPRERKTEKSPLRGLFVWILTPLHNPPGFVYFSNSMDSWFLWFVQSFSNQSNQGGMDFSRLHPYNRNRPQHSFLLLWNPVKILFFN